MRTRNRDLLRTVPHGRLRCWPPSRPRQIWTRETRGGVTRAHHHRDRLGAVLQHPRSAADVERCASRCVVVAVRTIPSALLFPLGNAVTANTLEIKAGTVTALPF